MKADAAPLLAIFEKKLRLEVPLFQRQYVWGRDHQWEPLWEDIARKFIEYLEGRKDAPVHFLGAMVLDQKQTPTTHVEKRQVIDGQQRLTTLQIFLAAFRDFCREQACEDLARECEGLIVNRGMMADPETDQFKVWPTQLDRQQFADVIKAGSRRELERRYPRIRRKYARSDDPRPRMVEAYVFFNDELCTFFVGTVSDPPLAENLPLAERLEESFNALKNGLQVVVIDLERDDDAQIIFETLNARGEPLLPADLLRNFIFLRAARLGEPQEALYNEYWRRFDDPFWREEVRQGRLFRPRSDLFMQHFLASRQLVDIPVKHLFVEYKYWIRKQPFPTVQEELATIARQGDDFRRIIEPKRHDTLFPLVTFLDCFDIRTAYPLLLYLLDKQIAESDWNVISRTLESYLLRRSVCGLTTKAYNRIFLNLTRSLVSAGTSPANIVKFLSELTGDSSEWPSDESFRNAWETEHFYHVLQNPKVVYILKRLNDTYLSAKSEEINIESPLTIEHIMPQSWLEQWPLQDGSQGLEWNDDMWQSAPNSPRAEATRRRNALLQTIGNLTIVTQPLNSAVSNGPWMEKKPALLNASLLPINQQLYSIDIWDETTIAIRSSAMFERALGIWPRPRSGQVGPDTGEHGAQFMHQSG